MGTEVAVASVIYNMAGDITSRPDYLKTLTVRNILSGTKDSIATTYNNGYLNGPSMQLRSFYRWASRSVNYGQIGMPTGSLRINGTLAPSLVEPFIPLGGATSIWAQSASIGEADILKWAEQWILDNRLSDIDTAWVADYDAVAGNVTVTFVDTSTQVIPVTGFDTNGRYIYAYYSPITAGVSGDTQMFIYKIGSGNATLDALVETAAEYDGFFPFIPFRLYNNFVSETHFPDLYPQVTKAYKKATGGKLADLVDQLKINTSLGDIDFGYIVFGVSLNTLDNSGKRYIYNFFKMLSENQSGDAATYAAWVAGQTSYESAMDTWEAWKLDPVGPEPPRPTMYDANNNSIRVTGQGHISTNYDVRLNWKYVQEYSGSGLGKVDAKVGEVWMQHLGTDVIQRRATREVHSSGTVSYTITVARVEKMRIFWQTDAAGYTYLDVYGAEHHNYIYGSKAVKTSSKTALEDSDESDFIVPLYLDVMQAMSLKDQAQMATIAINCVFNCFEVHKTKWYESGIFRILLVIVIAIASVVFTGGAGFGLLGAHLAVGSALGFTGLTAAIVGSVVNALAAVILSTLLEKTLGGLGVLGSVLSALVMILAGQVAGAFQSGGLSAIDWTQVLRVDNLLKLTQAVGQGFAKELQTDAINMQNDLTNIIENAKRETAKIQQAYFNEFGYGAGTIDPFMFVDGAPEPRFESSDTFLTRTLMTGSDIAEMSRELVYEFPALSLTLPDAFT
jgi:hypothetical protein